MRFPPPKNWPPPFLLEKFILPLPLVALPKKLVRALPRWVKGKKKRKKGSPVSRFFPPKESPTKKRGTKIKTQVGKTARVNKGWKKKIKKGPCPPHPKTLQSRNPTLNLFCIELLFVFTKFFGPNPLLNK